MNSERTGKMSNKLKDVFSNKMFEMGGNLSFLNQEAHNKFLEALEIVYDEGRTVKVDGVSAISTYVKDGNMIYPLMVESIPTELVVGPSVESIFIRIDTVCGKKSIKLQRYQTKSNIVLESIENAIVFLKFVFEKDRHQVQFTYRKQVQFAKKVKDVAESYCIAMGILNYFFIPYNEQDAFDNMDSLHMLKQAFQMAYSFWNKLSLIEEELALSFLPEKIDSIEENMRDVEELYLLLIEKKVVRMDAKLTSTDSTGITLATKEQALEIGQAIDLTFTGDISYSIYEQNITIYTANLLSNAKIKEISETENGEARILYDDTDSMPMYISCTGHKTSNEAKEESSLIMRDKERTKKYREALTVNEYYMQESGN